MFAPLPDVPVPDGIRKGRVPREGYQRGLYVFDYLDNIADEPLFRSADSQTHDLTLVTRQKRANLYLIITRFLDRLPDRNIVEFGSYKGGNALFMALILREVAPEATVYALDTFEGMPKSDRSVDLHQAGDFRDVSMPELVRRIDALKLTNVEIVKGYFEYTFPMLAADKKFGLAYIDADIYSACKYAQDAVWGRMTAGGYVAHDDADFPTCLGAAEAVEEFIQEGRRHSEQIWPHFVFRAGL